MEEDERPRHDPQERAPRVGPIETPDRPELERLAAAYGIEATYEDWRRRRRDVPSASLLDILASLEVDATDLRGALHEAETAPWRRLTDPAVVLPDGDEPTVVVRAPSGTALSASLRTEDGTDVGPLAVGDAVLGRRLVDEVSWEARLLRLPDGLPHGDHELVVEAAAGNAWTLDRAAVIVTPAVCPTPPDLRPVWGWMLQLYALRSGRSWGVGDLADLRELCDWSARTLGAGFVLCNPLHAATPVIPMEPSPYYPSSRRFTNALYLRPEELPEYEAAPPETRAAVDEAAARGRARNHGPRIDRDAAWLAKRAALELLHAGIPPERQARLAYFRAAAGRALEDFALFCSLAEQHGPRWQDWPGGLRHPDGPGVPGARVELRERVAFHAWLQLGCEEQLHRTQAAAHEAGMPIGVLHDLAVGVDPGGADAWALQDELALGATIGAPPDGFNQRGQDWQLPPLRPDRLAETGYRAFRETVRAAMRHGGGLRIDHILGLFRLWWVPAGRPPSEGAYVRYPHRDLLGILSLEAERAGALVVGEDLGTVPRHVRDTLAAWQVFGSRVVYFERTDDGERRLAAAEYPERALTTVTTHDLPTVTGWWTGEGVRVQAELGMLGENTTVDAELDRTAADREELAALLVEEGLLDDPAEASVEELVEATHAFCGRTPSMLVAAALSDALGDARQPNLPGTVDEYPNWRLPLAEPDGDGHSPVLAEALPRHHGVARLAAVISRNRVKSTD